MNQPEPTSRPGTFSRLRGRPALAALGFLLILVVGLGLVGIRAWRSSDHGTRSRTPGSLLMPGPTNPRPNGLGLEPRNRSVPEEIASQVAEVRGLDWKRPPAITLASRAEVARGVREALARDLDPARLASEEALFKLLRLVPPETDYRKTLEDLLASEVVGFYDSETQQIVVRIPASGELDPAAKMTIAHELGHALTDQHFKFGQRQDALDRADKQEESQALSSLVEGDAVLLQYAWAGEYLSEEEQIIAIFGGEAGSTTLDAVPPFLLDALLFQYLEGLKFVERLYEEGGFAAVDRAYLRPPTSTEQILHPDLYRAGESWSPPPLPNLSRAIGCRSLRSGTLGEFTMGEMLEEQLLGGRADEAAAGWNGDAFALVDCGGAVGMVDRWQADDEASASRLREALAEWSRGWSGSARGAGPDGRFSGPLGAGRILAKDSQVVLVLADDAATVERLSELVARSW